MPLPLPPTYDERHVGDLYLERAQVVTDAARLYARAHGVRPAREDRERVCAFGIDVQVGFCTPGASLFVPGAVEDTQRALRWLYTHLDRVTTLVLSMDTHRAFQIFHPAWWQGPDGRPPPPLTPVTAADVRAGRWTPTREPEATLDYLERLERGGRYVHTVWPYHVLLGGLSHALVPAVMEASLFHAIARDVPTHLELKGEHALTENYSVLSPEVLEVRGQPVGTFNTGLFEKLMSHDRVYVFGQAKSHCVLSTLNDLRQRIEQTDPGLMSRVYVLEDAMSPVPAPPLEPLPPGLDFPRLAEEGLRKLEAAGMRRVRTTDPL